MKMRFFSCSIIILLLLIVTMFSGCSGEADDEPVLPEEQGMETEDETEVSVKGSPGTVVETPEGILVNESKVLGDRIIIVLENTASEKIFLSKIETDILYSVDHSGAEHFEKQMNSYIEPGKLIPVTIRVRTLSDWQDSKITKIIVSS